MPFALEHDAADIRTAGMDLESQALVNQEQTNGRGATSPDADKFHRALAYSLVLTVAAIGLGYELALGAAESFLLGDPIVQFALIVGLYMSSLGLGAFASERVQSHVHLRFLDATLATALLGGGSAPLLFVVFAFEGPFRLVLYVLTVLLGTLVGIQFPLLMRMLKQLDRFADLIARAFAWDYAGALLGSIAFSLLLMPQLGLIRTTTLFGLLQVAGGFVLHGVAFGSSEGVRVRRWLAVAVAGVLLYLWFTSGYLDAMTERAL